MRCAVYGSIPSQLHLHHVVVRVVLNDPWERGPFVPLSLLLTRSNTVSWLSQSWLIQQQPQNPHRSGKTGTMASSVAPTRPLINLLRGWPSPSMLPAQSLKSAAEKALSDPAIFVPGLQYGPDPGYQPLRDELARWLGEFYGVDPDPARICITGGASQNVACVLQSFTDPVYTRAVWMTAPCYHLACPIFADSGFGRRLRAVPEDEDGIDVEYLERELKTLEGAPQGPVSADLDHSFYLKRGSLMPVSRC
jgi:DNA-binding transcriptional MocR family regulator